MKGRESGMPSQDTWDKFFDAPAAVVRLLSPLRVPVGNVVEFGCGYGTFTIPAAMLAVGVVTALDIEPEMVAYVRAKARAAGLPHINAELRDFVEQGSGLDDESQAHAMIYNLLHIENPLHLLREAARNLRAGGSISVIHWRSDVPTPRGPPLAMRPTPEQCAEWLREAGFHSIATVELQDICPYHYGMIAVR